MLNIVQTNSLTSCCSGECIKKFYFPTPIYFTPISFHPPTPPLFYPDLKSLIDCMYNFSKLPIQKVSRKVGGGDLSQRPMYKSTLFKERSWIYEFLRITRQLPYLKLSLFPYFLEFGDKEQKHCIFIPFGIIVLVSPHPTLQDPFYMY